MGRHVLVVEDEPLMRMDAVSMLETAGLSVVEFDRADEAYRFARSHPGEVAAIFTDVNLRGGMDGIDLALEVSRTSPGLPIIVTSGRYKDRPPLLPENAIYLKKPWMPADLLGIIQDAVDR